MGFISSQTNSEDYRIITEFFFSAAPLLYTCMSKNSASYFMSSVYITLKAS